VDVQTALITIGGATVSIIGGLVWLHVQQRTALERLDDRMAHLLAGISLLTDTTESALRDVAGEITRMAATVEVPRVPARVPAQRRVAGAARRGHTVRDIAATEQMSEGEVRLRLQLEQAHKERVSYASMR
jgi:hypothetical protein